MHPAMILAAAAGGAMVWDWWRNRATNNASDEEARKKAMQSAVTSFEAGDSYSVQMMVIPDKLGATDLVTASNAIKSTMEQYGWKILSSPQLRNDVAKAAWDKKQPAEWVFTGVWRRRDKTYMDIVPPWLGMAMVFKLPIAKDPSAII